MSDAVSGAWMRGGTSKGGVFLAADLPADPAARDSLLLRIMGSPDPRQIDGLGGAHPLTSKVAVVSPSPDERADIGYLFLQVQVDRPVVSAAQTCGNMLAAVGPFAIERGLVAAVNGTTTVRVRLVNTGAIAELSVCTPQGVVTYDGEYDLPGVPGTAAPILIRTPVTRPVLPTGHARDLLAGYEATCVDVGMPSVLLRAADLGLTGHESPAQLEANAGLVASVRAVRLAAIEAMRLPGDPEAMPIPKVVLLSEPAGGGTIATRSFIPERVHQAIGVLGGAGVAAAVRLPGTVASELAAASPHGVVRVEHPSGHLDVGIETGDDLEHPIVATTMIRTARKLFDGLIYPAPSQEGITS